MHVCSYIFLITYLIRMEFKLVWCEFRGRGGGQTCDIVVDSWGVSFFVHYFFSCNILTKQHRPSENGGRKQTGLNLKKQSNNSNYIDRSSSWFGYRFIVRYVQARNCRRRTAQTARQCTVDIICCHVLLTRFCFVCGVVSKS